MIDAFPVRFTEIRYCARKVIFDPFWQFAVEDDLVMVSPEVVSRNGKVSGKVNWSNLWDTFRDQFCNWLSDIDRWYRIRSGLNLSVNPSGTIIKTYTS